MVKNQRCVDKEGNELPPSRSHSIRRRDALLHQTGEVDMNKRGANVTGSTGAEIVPKDKESRVQVVLWGIDFARNVMKVSQAQLDRNLAEMIVDHEMDLKLF
jgi:hypothetical protein